MEKPVWFLIESQKTIKEKFSTFTGQQLKNFSNNDNDNDIDNNINNNNTNNKIEMF